MSPKNQPKIQWTDELKLLLFKTVQEVGVHITEYGKTDEKWQKVNEKFFAQPITVSLKGNSRKLRDVYTKYFKECSQFLTNGNTSKCDGDLSPLYLIVKQLMYEQAEEEEKREGKKQLVEKLNSIEAAAIDSAFVKNKRLKTESGAPVTPKLSHFDSELLTFLRGDERVPELERRVEERLTSFTKDIGVEAMVAELEMPSEMEKNVLPLLQFAGKKTILSAYCCPGQKFDQLQFKHAMVEFGLSPLVAAKLYLLLENWRKSLPEEVAMPNTPSPRSSTILEADFAN